MYGAPAGAGLAVAHDRQEKVLERCCWMLDREQLALVAFNNLANFVDAIVWQPLGADLRDIGDGDLSGTNLRYNGAISAGIEAPGIASGSVENNQAYGHQHRETDNYDAASTFKFGELFVH